MDSALLSPALRRRAWLGRWGLPLASLLACLVVTVRTHSFFMVPYATPVSIDEGYLAAMALRMFRGHWLPYVDGVSQRGPILYWLAAIFLKLTGTWSWMGMRLLGVLLASVTIALSFALAATLFSPMAGALAAMVTTYFLTYELSPWDGVGVNGEPVAVSFALGAALLVARLQLRDPPRRGWMLFWAGVLTACAGLSKQMFLIHGLPIGLWILLGPRNDRPFTWRDRRREMGLYVLGFSVPYVLVVGLYTVTGHLSTFVYYYQRYGREIFMDPLTWSYVRDKIREQIDRYYLGVAAVGVLTFHALARAVRQTLTPWPQRTQPSEATSGTDRTSRWTGLVTRLREHAVPWYAILHMVCAFVGACFTFRFFPHYFVQFFPFAAVVIAGVAAASYEKLSIEDRPGLVSAFVLLAGGVVLLSIANSALHRNVRIRRETDRWYQDPASDPIVRYVTEKTTPDQTIFVWGFRAETYLSSRRWPASRYIYTVYPAGVVPWFQATPEEEERRVVPGSREQLLADLEREKPELVIDAGRSMSGRYMYNYPALRAYLDRNYCFMRYVDGEPVYRRRHGERCPPADY